MLRILQEMIEIPVGLYLTSDNEQPQKLEHNFQISKNLVTNLDFNEYLNSTGKQKMFPVHQKMSEVDYFDDFPVVNLNWFDAIDYCDWLSKEINLQITLPSELQWEQAARGSDGRIYPWGEFYEPNRSPSLDAQSMSPSPVGTYPAGASEFGVLDMCGNVWQWTNTKTDSEEIKLKGGCWMDSGWGVRANRHLLADPKLATNNTGFRFVINGGN
jgi:formylglycine-generating enzyme required for sulfatase activity